MKCIFCGEKLNEFTTQEYYETDSRIIFVRGIPCYKCSVCGEREHSLKVGVRVEEIVDTLKKNFTADIVVAQYSPTEINVIQYTEVKAA